jgi:arginine/lysine/ornithine decarboxylase
LDLARHFLATLDQTELYKLDQQMEQFKRQLGDHLGFHVAPAIPGLTDPLKITLQIPGESGYTVKEKFEDLGFFPELADPMNVLLAFGLDRAFQAECVLNKLKPLKFEKVAHSQAWDVSIATPAVNQLALDYNECEERPKRKVLLKDAEGLVSGEDIIPYPPGIPVLLEGEWITQDHIRAIQQWVISGASFHGNRENADPFRITVFSKS